LRSGASAAAARHAEAVFESFLRDDSPVSAPLRSAVDESFVEGHRYSAPYCSAPW
jgi:hypothetical protein